MLCGFMVFFSTGMGPGAALVMSEVTTAQSLYHSNPNPGIQIRCYPFGCVLRSAQLASSATGLLVG